VDTLAADIMAFVALSAAVAAVSVTITLSKIALPFRSWVKSKSPFVGDLVSCPYCFSHWGSLIAVLLFQPRFVHSPWWLLDYLVSIFAMVTYAAVFVYIIFHTYGSQSHKN